MASRWSPLVPLVPLLVFLGCDRPGMYDRTLTAQGAYVLDGAFLTFDTARELFVRVDVSGAVGAPHAITRHAVGGATPIAAASVTGEALLVLDPDERTLTRLPADGSEPRVYDLQQPFNRTVESEDGRFLVAYNQVIAGEATSGDAVAENLLAIVDFTAAPSETNPAVTTVSSYGGDRLGIDLSPEFVAAGVKRRLAVVRSVGHVALVDLTDPSAVPIAVPLVVPGDPVQLAPRPAVFAPREVDAGGLWVFLTASGSGDVIQLEVVPEDGTGLSASLNQHAVGGWVDTALPAHTSDGALHVLALSTSSRVLGMIDVASGTTRTFQLTTPFSTVQVFDVAGEDGTLAPHALLTASGSANLGLLALDEVATRGAKALRLRSVQRPYAALVPVPGEPRFVAFDSGSTRLTLGSLLREAENATVALPGAYRDFRMAEDGARLYVLADGSPGDFVVSVDLASGLPTTVVVDDGAVRLDVIPGSGMLLVTHGESTGLLTLLDPAALERERAERILGFLLDGLMDE